MIFHSTYNKPILLVGNGVRADDAVGLLHKFVKKTNIPLLTTMTAVDLAQDELHIGFIGTHGNRVANMILDYCDLIISIGARLGIRQVGRDTARFAPNAKLIRCDIDEYELSRDIKKDEEKYHTGAGDFIGKLLEEDIPDYTEWRNRCLRAKDILEEYDKQPGNRAVERISEILPANAIVSVDVGMNQCWCAQSLRLKGMDGRIHISGGYGTMGCALPFAIGSSIAEGRKKVFCITGDGGMQMNIQELETIRREKLPVKIFILNNRSLGKIEETQRLEHDGRFANTTQESGYTVPDFVCIAKAYGIKSRNLDEYERLIECKDWMEDDEPCLIDILLPTTSRLTPKIQFDTMEMTPGLDVETMRRVESLLR